MTQPKLLVVMPNYNHARYLAEALQALLDQSYRPMKIIVVDNGSTDNSDEILQRFAQANPCIRLICNEHNQGISYSVNRVLAESSGEYLYFAAADDRVLPGLFEKSMNLLVHYPQAGLCSTLSCVMNERGEYKGLVHTPIISRTECFLPPERALAMLRRHGTWFMGNTAIYRCAALIEAGGFIPALGAYCDGFIDLVLALKYGACFIPESLAVWRKMSGSYSHRTSADLEVMLGITRTTVWLMRTRYRELFPPDYVEEWERGWRFVVGTRFARASLEAQVGGLARVLPSPGRLDRAFLSTLTALLAVGEFATRLYLFARLKRAQLWREVVRKLRHVADPRVLRLAKGKAEAEGDRRGA